LNGTHQLLVHTDQWCSWMFDAWGKQLQMAAPGRNYKLYKNHNFLLNFLIFVRQLVCLFVCLFVCKLVLVIQSNFSVQVIKMCKM